MDTEIWINESVRTVLTLLIKERFSPTRCVLRFRRLLKKFSWKFSDFSLCTAPILVNASAVSHDYWSKSNILYITIKWNTQSEWLTWHLFSAIFEFWEEKQLNSNFHLTTSPLINRGHLCTAHKRGFTNILFNDGFLLATVYWSTFIPKRPFCT